MSNRNNDIQHLVVHIPKSEVKILPKANFVEQNKQSIYYDLKKYDRKPDLPK